MTRRIYEIDPYLIEFDAMVLEIDGDWISLDQTAFYPGGGGQDKDIGSIDGLKMTDSQDKGGIRHKVPGHSFIVGQKVHGELDWQYRYDLMKAHTAEHLFFSALSRRTDFELVKIFLTDAKKSLIVKGEISWDLIREALEEVNDIIEQGIDVTVAIHRKDEIDERETRIKMDRIHGDSVRVVCIGDHDQAACAGVHVKNTREIGFVLVTKITSARPVGDYDIEFQIGKAAKKITLTYSLDMLMASETLGANPNDFAVAFNNAQVEHEKCREALRTYGKKVLDEIEPTIIAGLNCYCGSFPGVDRKLVMEKATALAANERTVVVMVQEDEKTFLVLSRSDDLEIDCTKLLNSILGEFEGRGGGKANFATGGTPLPVDGALLIDHVLSTLKRDSDGSSNEQ